MAAPDDPARIDIELVSHDGERSPFARGADEQAIVTRPAEPAGRRDDRRVVVAAIAVGVVGLAFGWLLGRSAPPGDAGVTPVEVATSTSAPRESVDTIAPVAPETASSISAADRAEPAVIESSPVSSVAVAARLLGQSLEVVAVGSDRDVVTIDLATGSVEVQAVGSQPFGRPDLLVGADWVLIPSTDALLASTLLRRSERPATVEVGTASDIVGSDGELLWVVTRDVATRGPSERVEVRILSLDGDATETAVAVPGRPVGVDPAGGVVVRAPGGWFHVDVSARHRITSGDLLALGTDRALARECSDQLECSLVLIDRGDERRTQLSLGSGSHDTRSWVVAQLGGRAASISPDGSAALVEIIDTSEPSGLGTMLGLVDLSTGHVVPVGETVAPTQYEFSPDGRFVFFIRSGASLVAYDRSDGALIEVVAGGLTPEAFGVRASAEP